MRRGLTALLAGVACAALAPAAQAASPSIAEIQAALGSGSTTCHAIVADALARIDAAEAGGELEAVLEINPDALAIADELDAARAGGEQLGPLACVPTLIKDNYETADRLHTTVGSLTMRGYRSKRDAFVVERLREAGAVVVGKTNMDEWAHGANGYSSIGGQTHNGRNPLRGPGGSSGGSAAALAAGLVPLATGSDTGGSIQIPASYNGVVGLRSTMGLISRDGVVPYTSLTDVPGPLVDSVSDLATVLGTLTGVDRDDPATLASRGHLVRDYTPFLDANGLAGARIGVLHGAFGESFDGASVDVRAAFEQSLATMRAAGATVVDDLPPVRSKRTGWQPFLNSFTGRFRTELDAWFAGPGRRAPVHSLEQVIERSSKPSIRPKVKILKALKGEQAAPDPVGRAYERAFDRFQRIRGVVVRFIRRHDLDAVVFPGTGCPAPPLPGLIDPTYQCDGVEQPLEFDQGGGTLAPLLSPATGLPVLTIPGAAMPGDQFVGVSLLAGPWTEGRLIRLGFAFEVAQASSG